MMGPGPAPGGGDAGPADKLGAGLPQGLSWSWEMDFEALLAALSEPAPWDRPLVGSPAAGRPAGGSPAGGSPAGGSPAAGPPRREAGDAAEDDQEALLTEYLASESRELPLGMVAGRIAESLPTGPDLAGWLATTPVRELEDGALAGIAASWRRLASWAQAGELAAVAQIASRSAADDEKIGVDADGRPARMPGEAVAQISLALAMSQYGASWWTDLAIALSWRLAATGAALAAGHVDLSRARLIAEFTAPLDDDAARTVEARVLPEAGGQTTGQLRDRLRRAVIAADPEGAERRRQEAERRAKVCLYPDAEGTATLAGHSLPGISAAAATARINAMARAMRAGGAGGGIDLLRAQVFLGLLLGTLPYIPPAPGGPPDEPPADGMPGAPPPDEPPADRMPGAPPPDEPPADRMPSAPPPDEPLADDSPADASGDSPSAGYASAGDDDDDDEAAKPAPAWPPLPAGKIAAESPALMPGALDLSLPWTTWAGLSAEPGTVSRLGPVTPSQARALADLAAGDPAVRWRVILTSPTGQAIAVTAIPAPRPRAGPRAGPGSPGPDDHGGTSKEAGTRQKEAGTRQRDGPPATAGLVNRVTVTIPENAVTQWLLPETQLAEPLSPEPLSPGPLSSGPLSPEPLTPVLLAPEPLATERPPFMLTLALQAAARAVARVAAQAAASSARVSSCGHETASKAYRPSPTLREYVIARDVTCRFPFCRQPAWRGDLDHTKPYDKGGRTCSCNLGGLCRYHHQLKQHRDWELTQPEPGLFRWTTPAGRNYLATPDIHSV